MNTLTLLLIGHLVGDFVLQNDWMAKGKKKHLFSLPGLTHYLVYTATVLAFLLIEPENFSGLEKFALAGVFLFITHWLIDATPLVTNWMRFYRQTDIPLVRITVDQTFHLLAIVVVTLIWYRW